METSTICDLIKASSIWLQGPEPLRYSTEADLTILISATLRDLAEAIAKLLGEARLLSFSRELEVDGEKADIWVIMRRGRPVGVIEVKKPGKDAMSNEHILGELYDYMMTSAALKAWSAFTVS